MLPTNKNNALKNENMEDNFFSIETDYYKIKKAYIIIRSINHEIRKKIIDTLHDKKKMTVTELYNNLDLEQSIVSQHLAILRKAGVVNAGRNGKYIYYSVNYDYLDEINDFVKNITR